MSEWKPITDLGLYDPKASDKDADVTIKSSQLNRLKYEAAQIPRLLSALKEAVTLIESMRDTLANKYDHFTTRSGDSRYVSETLALLNPAKGEAMREQPVKVRHAIEHADLVALVKERDDALAQIPALQLLLKQVIQLVQHKPGSGDSLQANKNWWNSYYGWRDRAIDALEPSKEKP